MISAAALAVVGLAFPVWSVLAAKLVAGQMAQGGAQFRVRQVDIIGTRALSIVTVAELAAVRKGTPLFRVPVQQVAARIARHPWVRHACVHRRLPDTIEIQVLEREPVAALRGETVLLVTSDSVVVAPLAGKWAWDLPMLTPPRAVRFQTGSALKDSSTLALLREALELRALSPETWRNLSELYYLDGQMHATLTEPAVDLVLGRGASALTWTGALELLAGRTAALGGDAEQLDLRFPGRIVVTHSPSLSEKRVNG